VSTAEETTEEWERLATNLRVERALLDALDCLEDVRVVVFKGPTLTRMIFGDLRQRASADNDLWVARRDANRALHRLLRAGYSPLEGIDPERAMKRYGQVALWPAGDPSSVSLDLHVEPFSARYFDVPETVLEANLVPVDVQGHALLTFSKPLALCHLVAHFVQHHLTTPQLENFAHACHEWGPRVLQEAERLAPRTCSAGAFEYSVWLARRRGLLGGTCPELRGRSGFVAALGGIAPEEKHSIVRKFLAVWVSDPKKLPQGVYSSVCLDPDDLHSRYGNGRRATLLGRHFLHLLQR